LPADESRRLKAGMLLLAEPTLIEPNFARAVVLVCQHDQEGTIGLVINRPTSLACAAIFPDEPALWGRVGTLFQGGPVQRNSLLMLHRFGGIVPGSLPVVQGLSLGGDMDVIRQLLSKESHPRQALRLYLGYAGWGAGQLQQEIEAGAWRLKRGSSKKIFSGQPLGLWPRLMGLPWKPAGSPLVLPQGPALN
jgi:putative transcriptional regulator